MLEGKTRNEILQYLGISRSTFYIEQRRIREAVGTVADDEDADVGELGGTLNKPADAFPAPPAVANDELTRQSQNSDEALDELLEIGPDLLCIWDPEALSPELYADLVEAVGNVVRSCGGAGLERTRYRPIAISSFAGVKT